MVEGFIFERFGDDFGNGKLEVELNRKEVWMDEFGIKCGFCEIKIDKLSLRKIEKLVS